MHSKLVPLTNGVVELKEPPPVGTVYQFIVPVPETAILVRLVHRLLHYKTFAMRLP